METSLFVLEEFLVMVKFFAVLFMVLGMSCVASAQGSGELLICASCNGKYSTGATKSQLSWTVVFDAGYKLDLANTKYIDKLAENAANGYGWDTALAALNTRLGNAEYAKTDLIALDASADAVFATGTAHRTAGNVHWAVFDYSDACDDYNLAIPDFESAISLYITAIDDGTALCAELDAIIADLDALQP